MKQKRLIGMLIAVASSAGAAQTAPAEKTPPAAAPFVAADARETVDSLAMALEKNFVFPEVGDRYAAALRSKLASGGYAGFNSSKAFAEAVTADLQKIHKDGHLRLFAPQVEKSGAAPRPPGPPSGGIERSGWIADGIAYIGFDLFPGDEATLTKLRAFLEQHSSARTLIIDARRHRGGGLAEMDVLFPYLFAEQTTLVEMDTRAATEAEHGPLTPEGPTLKRVSSPETIIRRAHIVLPGEKATPLRTAKVFLLTSRRTGSAAEHLAMALKRTGRATLIGETTVGAGHFGGQMALVGGYSAFVPVGRTFDPTTGEGWEGTGVSPNVAVSAERALTEALVRSGIAQDKAATLAAPYDAKPATALAAK